jgi:hypothetical protein
MNLLATSLTITIYRDGSKLDDGRTGAGWSIYCISQGVEKLATEESCFLGDQIEVYDAEPHAVHEELISLSKINTLPGKTYICIDISAAICSIEQNIHNSEPARQAILTAHKSMPDRMVILISLDTIPL